MRRREVTALLSEVEHEVLRFRYEEHHFARVLLRWARARHGSYASLRRSIFARLLDRPPIRRHFARLPPEVALDAALAEEPQDLDLRYRITFGRWGDSDPTSWPSYCQTSRPGENLVLQLNFTRSHNRAYQALLRPCGRPFSWSCHPVQERLNTLSWARIDLEQSAGEATIEEIQSDWVGDALAAAKVAREGKPLSYLERDIDADADALLAYVDAVLAPHARFWAEATLTAALWWLVERRGVRRIFYNTWETGNVLKNLSPDFAPPRSLYTDLPRRFCFELTRQIPKALARSKVPAVQRRIRGARLTASERLYPGGPWCSEAPRSSPEPRWFLLEV